MGGLELVSVYADLAYLQTDGRLLKVHGFMLVPRFLYFGGIARIVHHVACIFKLEMLGPEVCMTVALGVSWGGDSRRRKWGHS